jgi:structural maintenance of chromosome 3 (chondroitin sulfate proteoglycan 6)
VNLSSISADLGSLKERRVALLDEQKRLWRREHELKVKRSSLTDTLRHAESKLSHLSTLPVSSALAFLESRNVHLTFGPLIDLIELDPALDLAVDAAARSRLFYVVVETDRIAEDLITLLQRENAGRLSFFGLNRVKPHKPPITRTANVSPLVEELTFDERIRPVVESVFGGVALCSTFEVAVQTSSSLGVTCVTLSGDIVFAAGPMVGGADEALAGRRSPTRTRRLVRRFAADVSAVDEELAAVAGDLARADRELKALSGEIISLSSGALSAESAIQTAAVEHAALRREIAEADRLLGGLRKRAASTAQAARAAAEREAALRGRRDGGDSGAAFSAEAYRAVCAGFAAAMLEAESLRAALEDCVVPDLRRLEGRLRGLDAGALERRLAHARQKLDHHERRVAAFDGDLKDAGARSASLSSTIESLEKAGTRAREKLASLERELANQQRCVSEYNNALLLQTAKRDELLKKISALGAFPAAEIEARRGLGYAELMREMNAANRELARFRFVNKRAYDQFRQFRDQREALELRRAEIAAGNDAIVELIQQLDRNKAEAVCACFAKVSERFQAIYSEFNPDVRAVIVLKQQGERAAELDFEKVTGMGIVVENQPIEALSGGQRTLIALALIFALQHSEPSPFYLLDEVDADLDIAHAGRVARFIQGLAGVDEDPDSWTQVIYTSHRSEMIAAAKKYFAVFPVGRGGGIREVSFDEVAQYLEEERQSSDDE